MTRIRNESTVNAPRTEVAPTANAPATSEASAPPRESLASQTAEVPLSKRPASVLPDSEPASGIAKVALLAAHPAFLERPAITPAAAPSLEMPTPAGSPRRPPAELLKALMNELPEGSAARADVLRLLAMEQGKGT
jgi:hypothetical protein